MPRIAEIHEIDGMLERPIERRARELGFVPRSAPIAIGDSYLAERNTGPKLLTCRQIKDGYVVSVEIAYYFDLYECVKIG